VTASGAPNCGDPDPTVATLIPYARVCLNTGQLDEAEESLGKASRALAQLGDGGGDTLQQVVDMSPPKAGTAASAATPADQAAHAAPVASAAPAATTIGGSPGSSISSQELGRSGIPFLVVLALRLFRLHPVRLLARAATV